MRGRGSDDRKPGRHSTLPWGGLASPLLRCPHGRGRLWGTRSPLGEGRAHQCQAPFLRLRKRCVVSVTSPFLLLVSKGSDSPTLSVASCGPHTLQGARSPWARLTPTCPHPCSCGPHRAPRHTCAWFSVHRARVCTCQVPAWHSAWHSDAHMSPMPKGSAMGPVPPACAPPTSQSCSASVRSHLP